MRHKLLSRQIAKHLNDLGVLRPEQNESLQNFLKAVNDFYNDSDQNQALLQRSMEISSTELFEVNQRLRQQHSQMASLYKMLLSINDSASLKAACQPIADEIQFFTKCQAVFFELLNLETGLLEFAGSSQNAPNFIDITIFEKNNIGEFLTERYKEEQRLTKYVMFSKNEKVGVIYLILPIPFADQIDTVELNIFLETVGNQIVGRIERERNQLLILEQQSNMIAASKMSELGKMAGSIAHEINTPLAIITLLSDQIERSFTDQTDLDQDVILQNAKVISSTTARIAKIIYGLKAFSRDEKYDKKETKNVIDIIEDTLLFCKTKFNTRGIALKVEVPADLKIDCQATQLSQVILNLLNNSYDAISELADKWILIKAESDFENVEISLTDSGSGISDEVIEKMFNPFFTTKPFGVGTGLGLSISMGIVKSHGGILSYDKSSSHTRFVIQIPISEEKSLPIMKLFND